MRSTPSAPIRARSSRANCSSPCAAKISTRHQFCRRRSRKRRGRRDRRAQMERQTCRKHFALLRATDTLARLPGSGGELSKIASAKSARDHRQQRKTSTKDFAAAVLARKFRVTKTEGNFNNHVGLPRTMLEATSRGRGRRLGNRNESSRRDCRRWRRLPTPDAAIITNVGVAHIEFMGSREAIARRKRRAGEAVGPDGTGDSERGRSIQLRRSRSALRPA